MKKMITTLLLSAALAMTFVTGEAMAKRMGSGSDSGMQRSVAPAPSKSPSSQPASNSATAPAAAGAASTAAGAASKSSWMGPLLGLAAGGLLAAAFMGGAFDGISTMDIILLLLIAGALFFFLRRRAATASATAQPASASPTNYMPADMPAAAAATSSSGHPARDIAIGSRVGKMPMMAAMESSSSQQAPAWFDEQTFITQAKGWFVQLQAAWDKKDYAMLGAIVTPELLSELRIQREAQGENNVTKVDEVFAQVVEWAQDANQWVLTVRFNGYLSEKEGAFPHAFSEYWHLTRLGEANGEWKLAGIQQDN